jgi:branched-chain amino acid transport system substrate-binding protein
LGRRLELIQEDTQGKGQNAVSAFKKLAAWDGVKFIVGGHCTPETLPIAPLTRNQNVLILAAITSTPKFTGISPHALRLTQTNLPAGNLMARHAYQAAGHRRMAVLAEETDYVMPVAENFKNTFISQGGEVPVFVSFQASESDFRAIVAKVKHANVDSLYIGLQSPDTAALLARQARELGLKQPFYGNEQMGNVPQSQAALAPLFNGTIYAEPKFDVTKPHTLEFIDRYKKRFNQPALPAGIWTAEAYDAVRLLADTINRCGDDVEKVRACLVKTVNYAGVSGQLAIGPDGDGIRAYILKRVRADGNVEIVDFK